MTREEEIIEMLMLLKKSVGETVCNKIDIEQQYTILSNIKPSSFLYVIDQTVKALKKESDNK